METIKNNLNTLIETYNKDVVAEKATPAQKLEIFEGVEKLNAKIRETLIATLLETRLTSQSDFYRDFLNSMYYDGYGVKEDKKNGKLSLSERKKMLSVKHVETTLNERAKELCKKTGEKFFALSIAQCQTFHHHTTWLYDCLYAFNTSKDSGVDSAKVALKDEFLSEISIKAREEAGFSSKSLSRNKMIPMLKAIMTEFFGEYLAIEVNSQDVNFLLLTLQKQRMNTLKGINENAFIDNLMIVAETRMNGKKYEFVTAHGAYKKD